MIREHFFRRIQAAVLVLLPMASFAQATSQPLVTLPGSVKEVATWTQVGPPDPYRPFISRATLKPAESDATMEFEVALRMRNFSELQSRVANGERISLEEMTAKYHPLQSDYQATMDWLTGQGFTISRQDPNHLAVFARGKVSLIQKALQVTFARVSLGGAEYTSAVTAPSIPANLAPLLVGINGLQPHIRAHKHSVMRPADLTSTNPPFTPSQIAQAYNVKGLYSSNVTGVGQAIAIVIDIFPLSNDLTTFWQTYGISQSINNISFIQVVTPAGTTTSGEETLDVEWSSSMAPGSKVRVYATSSLSDSDLDEGYEQVYADVTTHPQLGIHQMSMSFGIGETYTTSSQVETDDQYFVALAGAGVTVFASAGDGGSTPGTGTHGGSIDETGPLQVESPASDPYVTGVGGTSLTLNPANGNESAETVWNNSGFGGATGGGTSEYFVRPNWQAGTGVPTGTMRLVPDVASTADPYTGAEFVYTDPTTGVQSDSAIGGTSWSSPTWAGYSALINQARANAGLPSVGLLGPKIYPLIGTSAFRDITSGNNATSKSGGLYSAGVGYDEATGVGVPLVQGLSQALVGTPTQPGFQNIVPGQSATITVAAGGSPLSYQWQRMPIGTTTWSNLSNNGTYTGSTTASLTVHGATTAMSGDQFQCVVTYAGPSSVTSTSSSLIVDTPYTIINLAGSAGVTGSANGTGSAATFDYPSGIALDSSGNLYIADYNNNSIRKVTPAGVVSTPFTGFSLPNAIVADKSNNLYVANTGLDTTRRPNNNTIQKIAASNGAVTTLLTKYNNPNGIAIDSSGNLYVADSGNEVIYKLTLNVNGTYSSPVILAGTSGTPGYVNSTTGTSAEFNTPTNLAVDSLGNVYVADYGNEVVRKITPAGAVSLFAGQPNLPGYIDGVTSKAEFNAPTAVAVDASNNVYVTDSLIPPTGSIASGNNLLRRISTAGVVSTIAGQVDITGSAVGTGTAAQFYSLQFATFNSAGEVFLADTYNQLIRAGGIVPAVATQPLAQVVTIGQPASFSITTSGTATLSYQWLKNGVAISGATAASFSIPSVASTNAGNYSVTVTNAFGSVTSNAVTLIPANSQPIAQTVAAGQNATFSISLAGSGPFTYQWLFNGVPISGATASSYMISNVTTGNAGSYSVLVSDSFGSATAGPVTLTVNPVITDTPAMPLWALVLLGVVLFFVAKSRLVGRSA
jgi:kumamolisin